MNLLLASFYADMIAHSPQFSAVFPGCPVDNAPKFLEIIDRIHSFTDTRRVTQRITSICQQPKSEGDRLVSWLLATFGSDFIEATYKSGLRIPGFGESVLQFVLPRPVLAHRENFTKHLKNAQNESILLFHGTSTRHLQSILRNGFIPAKDVRFGPGLFMAMEPELASRFAAFQLFDIFTESELNYDSDDVRPDWEKLKPWSNSPFNAHGVLLGCQVAGMGRPVDDDEDNADEGDVHVISQLDSITIRYIFLLPATDPDEEILDIFDDELPDRTEVEPAMTAAFKVIQKGIESLALVDGEAGEV
ncbi:hypothetical protein IFR05_010683 [Cadophora sp. M221]|nr:hypothetical protein IFR05_010683 [Cadophora sp. M221]